MAYKGDFDEIERISITVVTDNYYDALIPDPPCGSRYRTSPNHSIHAEHGLSYYIEVGSGSDDNHCLMFDYGIDPSGIIKNMQVIGLAPYKVEALALSHGHFDHWCGLEGILTYIEANNPGRQIPFFIVKGCFSHKFSIRPGTKDLTDLGELRKETIEQAGKFKVIETEGPEEVVHGIYTTGRIERTTSYEKVPDNLLVERDGVIGQDHFDEDMALFGIAKGKGLVIISGCAHAGIVNTIRHIQKMTGVEKVYAIIGGFHLVGAPYDVVERTIEDIGSIGPDYIIPAHCTGFYAIAKFAQMMPDRFILNTAGTIYRFS